MTHTSHVSLGEATGNPKQRAGRHRIFHMDHGCGLIPLGDRSREHYEYGASVVEERENNYDPLTRSV